MSEIAQAVLEEKIAQLAGQVQAYERLIHLLVYEAGKGKQVSISKGSQKQADQKIASVQFRQLSTGEIRFEVTAPPKDDPT